MRTTIISLLCVLVIVGLVAMAPTIREEAHWLWATYKDEPSSYANYLQTWQQGRHSFEARVLYDQLSWEQAQVLNTIEGFEQYLKLLAAEKEIHSQITQDPKRYRSGQDHQSGEKWLLGERKASEKAPYRHPHQYRKTQRFQTGDQGRFVTDASDLSLQQQKQTHIVDKRGN